MKKGFIIIVIALLFVTSVTPVVFGYKIESVQTTVFDGNILYVGGSGPNNYTTIQSAIDDALDGDTVFVYDDSSPYYESLTIDKSIILIGEDRNTTIIELPYTSTDVVIEVFDEDIKVCGFTILTDAFGIEIFNSFTTISNNIFKAIDEFYLYPLIIYDNSDNNIISENIILSSINMDPIYYWCDLLIMKSSNNIISNNTFIEVDNPNSPNHAILLEDGSYGNVIENNTIEGYKEYGIYSTNSCNTNNFYNNLIRNSKGGLHISGKSNIVNNNEIIECDYGIRLDYYSKLLNVTNNKIINTETTALVFERRSTHNTIYYNTIENSSDGISLSRFSNFNNIIQNNFINISEKMGFFRFFSFKNTWDGNYWDGPQESPYEIKGRLGLFIPWTNYDYNPAQEPYDIEVL